MKRSLAPAIRALIAIAMGGCSAAARPRRAADAAPPWPADAADATATVDGPPALWPAGAPPPLEGDGRLGDIPDVAPGGSPYGWDLGGAPYLGGAPRAGMADPPALRGERYLVYDAVLARTTSGPSSGPQLLLYIDEPHPDGPGLWLALARMPDPARDATLSVFTVDELDGHPIPRGVYSVAPLLTGAGWHHACVPYPTGDETVGLRLDAASGEIGLDAIRLGPACP
jgi:hypothetical protein